MKKYPQFEDFDANLQFQFCFNVDLSVKKRRPKLIEEAFILEKY